MSWTLSRKVNLKPMMFVYLMKRIRLSLVNRTTTLMLHQNTYNLIIYYLRCLPAQDLFHMTSLTESKFWHNFCKPHSLYSGININWNCRSRIHLWSFHIIILEQSRFLMPYLQPPSKTNIQLLCRTHSLYPMVYYYYFIYNYANIIPILCIL